MIANPVPWPNGARVAVAITLDMDADSLVHLEHPEDGHTRVSTISMLRYGPQVGIPRILQTYRKFGIRQTFFIPAWCIEQHPGAVEAIVAGGHEIGFHGYIHEAPNGLSREDEQYWLQRSIAVIEKATGRRPRGARAPLYNFSIHSADLLVEEGFLYDASLMGDDVPYILRCDKGDLVELPSHWALDDWPPYVHSLDLGYVMQVMAPDHAMEVFMAEFEAMREHGGLLARWSRVEHMIEYMQQTGQVWFATLEEIAQHVRDCTANGAYTSRVDRLPYYDGPQRPARELTAKARQRGAWADTRS